MKKTFILLTVALLSITAVSILTGCNRENTQNGRPVSTITLNMLNEDNGKTYLGSSDIYINSSNNFKSSQCQIANLGSTVFIPLTQTPQLSLISNEVAVKEGYAYQMFFKNSLLRFPSGNIAAFEGDTFYSVYVNTLLFDENNQITGANVDFTLLYPHSNALPPFGECIYTFTGQTEVFEYQLSPHLEYTFDNEWSDNDFQITQTDNTLRIKLLSSPNSETGPYGDYRIYVRDGTVYTAIYCKVK